VQDASTESFTEVRPEDLAELGSGKTSEDAGKALPSGASTPTEVKDECTPVGVDFERRARPKLKDCYAVAKKSEPNLEGTVKMALEINTRGKIKSIKVVEKTLPESVAQCMLKVLKTTPLSDADAAKCAGKTFTIPVTFPTPH
jgi:hypothetical protein